MANLDIENNYRNKIIAGVDEAGRGPLAGPVVAAAVIINQNEIIDGIKDSKKISAPEREKLYKLITEKYKFALGIIESEEIDQINILEATKKACYLAVEGLKTEPGIVIVDGNMKFNDMRYQSIIKGDNKSISIAAASIVAKVTRDRIMQSLSLDHPMYDWHKNSGYGTKYHINAILNHGITRYHRKSFAPIKNMV